jgi:hypothetical protein
MLRRKYQLISLAIVITVLCGIAFAQNGQTQRVRFKYGLKTAVLHGSVVSGTQNRYILGAKAGQTMTVHITSREKNAAFTILGPDATALPGTEEGADATDFSGELPVTGDYSVWVGPTRGNATYTLEITVR